MHKDIRKWVQSNYYSEITGEKMKRLGQVIQMLLDTGWKLYMRDTFTIQNVSCDVLQLLKHMIFVISNFLYIQGTETQLKLVKCVLATQLHVYRYHARNI